MRFWARSCGTTAGSLVIHNHLNGAVLTMCWDTFKPRSRSPLAEPLTMVELVVASDTCISPTRKQHPWIPHALSRRNFLDGILSGVRIVIEVHLGIANQDTPVFQLGRRVVNGCEWRAEAAADTEQLPRGAQPEPKRRGSTC
mmetsp:Transcript_46654/g.104560  ORF Transcript_46654/g.104560 Transcript_46654/m.104560 type:complete len:142 (-) Transcript_46654:348-773(-)